jgi:signal transduction histidine kinase
MKRVLSFYKNRYLYLGLILVLGFLFVFLLFRYTKSVEKQQVESQMRIESKSIAMNLDLRMANDILKIRNLEEILEIKTLKSRANQQIIQAIFENTIFGSFSVIKNRSPENVKPGFEKLDVVRAVRVMVPYKTAVPIISTQKVRSEALKRAIHEMIRDGDRQKQFFTQLDGQVVYVIITQSEEDKNYFYVLTGLAKDLLEEVFPKQRAFAITIEQPIDKTFWLFEKSDGDINFKQISSIDQSQRLHRFVEDYVKIDYEVQFSPKSHFVIVVYTPKVKSVIDRDRVILLFLISTIILFISFLIFYLMDRNFRIQELVRGRTRELEVETERSKQATIAKSRFLASISHEIRTPLNIVLGMTDLLEDTRLTQAQNHYLQSIRTSGGHLLSLLNDILDMTRIDLKEVIFKPIQVNSLSIISEACLAINEVAISKNLNLYCKISSSVPKYIFIDQARLKQILINLLMNAVKYTEKGAVELIVDVNKNESHQQFLSIQVLDTGIGIAEDNLDRIFKSFFQVDQNGANLTKGVGLGLSIVSSIVKRLSGDIQVQSQLGEGSQFQVKIPLRNSQSETWCDELSKNALWNKSRLLFLSSDEKLTQVMVSLEQALKLNVDFEKEFPCFALQRQYDFAFVDVRLVSPKILSRLENYVNKKIFIFDFDPLRNKQEIGLSKKFETIPNRLFLPQELIALLSGHHLASQQGVDTKSGEHDTTENKPLTVLIVEDDASNRILFQAYLANKTNWTVDYAYNGISALQNFLETKSYDVMVTDLQMPEMDGFTLLSKLDRVQKPARIVILSADSTEETAMRAKQFKVDQFITKPVRKIEFINAIEG